MSNTLTPGRAEDAIAATNAFLAVERGASLDGQFASQQVAERISRVNERADALLHGTPHPELTGLYVPLSKHNAHQFKEAVTVLSGYVVLVPSVMVEKGSSYFYPAVVSEDGAKAQGLRLHVLRQPYRQQLRYGASIVLSAAGQSETKGIGEHGRTATDGVESEHFATLLAAGMDTTIQAAWQNGQHINHTWRSQKNNSVTTAVSQRLFDQDIPQRTITVTKSDIESGKAMLLWHEGMRDQQNGQPETAIQNNALVVVQGLGFEALRQTSPQAVDQLKRLIAS